MKMKKGNIDRALLKKEIDYLSGFMLEQRFQILKNVVDHRTNYVTVCLENIFHSQNASAILRTSEAFGVQKVHVIETICDFTPHVNIVKGADKWIDIYNHTQPNATEIVVGRLKANGYRIVATSPHRSGVCCEDFDVTKGKIALFFGTEKTGISDTLTSLADEFITIPMYGFMESLNVSVASAITLQSLTKKLHDSSLDWQLSEDERLVLLNRWVKSSVKDSARILQKME